MSNVNIKWKMNACTSDLEGHFQMDDDSTDVPDTVLREVSGCSTVSFECEGFAPTTMKASESFQVVLRPLSATATMDPKEGGLVEDPKSGSSLTVPKDRGQNRASQCHRTMTRLTYQTLFLPEFCVVVLYSIIESLLYTAIIYSILISLPGFKPQPTPKGYNAILSSVFHPILSDIYTPGRAPFTPWKSDPSEHLRTQANAPRIGSNCLPKCCSVCLS